MICIGYFYTSRIEVEWPYLWNNEKLLFIWITEYEIYKLHTTLQTLTDISDNG